MSKLKEYELTAQHRKKIDAMLEKNGIEPDLVDITSLWDNILTPSENIDNIRKTLKLSKEIINIKAEQEKFAEQLAIAEREEIQKQFESTINQIKSSNVAELTSYYSSLYSYIEILIKNDKINGLIVIGKRGIGKTFNIIMQLENMGEKYVVVKGHITPLSLYKLLYQNANGIIILDDVVGLLKDDDVLSMLLGALDYDNKIVKWVSQSPLTQTLPSEFAFNGKIIILLNRLEQNEFLDALKDRCYCIELDFSNEQIIEMSYILANKRGYSYEVVDFLKEMSRASLQNLSLRTLDKAQNIYKIYNHNTVINWRDLAKEMLEYDDVLLFVEDLISNGKTVKEQIREFMEKGYGCRATYFNLKRKLKSKSLKSNSLFV